jgi:tryptophan-rich sensory protein
MDTIRQTTLLKDQSLFYQKNNTILALVGFILLCLLVGFTGAFLTAESVRGWYLTINKPTWTPPNYLFAPVWTTLYFMMGSAVWLVWRERHSTIAIPLALFFIQLFFNLIWSGLFFTLQSPILGLVDISILWLLITATIVSFWRVKPLAGLLLVPYLLWVSYATALNFAIWQMN